VILLEFFQSEPEGRQMGSLSCVQMKLIGSKSSLLDLDHGLQKNLNAEKES